MDFNQAKIYRRNLNKILRHKRTYPTNPHPEFDAGLTPKEIVAAYHKWQGRDYRYISADNQINQCTAKMARKALFKTAAQAAIKMGVSLATYSKLERAEVKGDVSIADLKKMAQALDCDFVYTVRPKKDLLFSEVIWAQLLPDALWRFWHRVCDPKNKSGGLAAVARDLVRDANYRRKRNWSRND